MGSRRTRIPEPVIVILETAIGYLDSIKLIDKQLAMLRSGKMTGGETTRAVAALIQGLIEDEPAAG